MSSEQIPERQFDTLVVLRHGLFEGNVQAGLTGKAAAAVVKAGRRRDDYDGYLLLPEGLGQATRAWKRFDTIRLGGAALSIDVCFCSPTMRTIGTAGAFIAGMRLSLGTEPGEGLAMELDEGLLERDRDMFAYMPDEWSKDHPLYPRGQPTLTRRFGNGETLLEVMAREQPVLERADKAAPGGAVLFVTHAEAMLSLRAEPTLGGMTEEQCTQPIMTRPPEGIRPLEHSAWVGHAQFDIYTKRNPYTRATEPHITFFRTSGEGFDSGWVPTWRMRGAAGVQ